MSNKQTEFFLEARQEALAEKDCENCGGKGFTVEDFHDPSSPDGHGQRELICECKIKNYEE